jgi:hypothetical protein
MVKNLRESRGLKSGSGKAASGARQSKQMMRNAVLKGIPGGRLPEKLLSDDRNKKPRSKKSRNGINRIQAKNRERI